MVSGDAFGIFYHGDRGGYGAQRQWPVGAATPEFFAAAGLDRIPGAGPLSVSVPGAVAGWVDAHERYGSMDFADLLATGITMPAMDSQSRHDWHRISRNREPTSIRPAGTFTCRMPQHLRWQACCAIRRWQIQLVATEGKEGFIRASPRDWRRLSSSRVATSGRKTANHTSTWVTPLRGLS